MKEHSRKIASASEDADTWRKVLIMKRKFKLDDYEINIIIRALIELRNQFVAENRYTDAVDDLLIKFYK